MAEDMSVDRGKGEDPKAALEAWAKKKLEEIFDRQRKGTGLELAGPKHYWEIFAAGPYQPPSEAPFPFKPEPHRLITLGEKAYMLIAVWLNPLYPPDLPACTNMTMHNDKIELFIYTSNMQTMQPAADLTARTCIKTVPHQCWYFYVWEMEPKEAACLYETNICARICNCADQPLPQHTAFVRWVFDLDYDLFFPPQGFVFDRPIRFMVSDPEDKCNCNNT